MRTNITTKIILDTRRSLSNGLYPVKLRVSYQRKSKYYQLNYTLSEKEFCSVMKTDSKGKHKKLLLEFTKTEQKAIRIIDKLEDFSFNVFDKLFLEKKNNENDLFKSIELNVEILLKYDRIKTARSFVNLNSSLKKYTKKSKLTFSQIKVTFLEDYEKWMLQTGHSITTVGIYLRNLRVIFNKAIENGIISRDCYPFGRTKYQIPTGKNIKKALTKEEVKKIMSYVPQSQMEAYYRDLWLFSYLANGANITDIANLTHDNIQDNFLIFIRKKTLRSNRQNPKIILLPFENLLNCHKVL